MGKDVNYYRERGYKFPRFTHAANSKMLPAVSVGVFLVGGIAMGNVVKSGLDSYSYVTAPPEDNSPYIQVAAQSTPAAAWALNFVSQSPPGVAEWNVGNRTAADHPFLFDQCGSQGDVPLSVLGTANASGSGSYVHAQFYGAGQASDQFDAYVKIYEGCFPDGKRTADNVFSFSNGFVAVSGDAIVSGYSPDPAVAKQMQDFYLSRLDSSLRDSQCVATGYAPQSSVRSFYMSPENYVGLRDLSKVRTTVSLENLPSPVLPSMVDFSVPKSKEPEAPLPAGFPTMPEKVEKPTVPAKPDPGSDFSENASYRVKDLQGPGCGWTWSGQQSPAYDDNELAVEKIHAINASQKNVDTAATNFVDSTKKWALQTGMVAPQIDQWNSYVSTVDKVNEKWGWLNTQRAALKPAWDAYVQNYNSWLTFDDRRAAAAAEYEKKLQECVNAQDAVLKWEEQWGALYNEQQYGSASDNGGGSSDFTGGATPDPNSSASPSPSVAPSQGPKVDIPPRPVGCDFVPARPAIVDQQKPAEPVPPVIPDGVTIPNSWKQPNQG